MGIDLKAFLYVIPVKVSEFSLFPVSDFFGGFMKFRMTYSLQPARPCPYLTEGESLEFVLSDFYSYLKENYKSPDGSNRFEILQCSDSVSVQHFSPLGVPTCTEFFSFVAV